MVIRFLAILLILLAVSACQPAESAPVELAAVATETPLPPTETPPPPTETPAPLETPTSEAPEATITPTPGSDYQPTGIDTSEFFVNEWQEVDGDEGRFGYPITPPITDMNFARQFFDNGVMYWWENPEGENVIWVLISEDDDHDEGPASYRFFDTWAGGNEYSCPQADTEYGPVRGFGKVWCDHPAIREQLGFPIEDELGSAGRPPFSLVQFFQGGVMIFNAIEWEIYLIYDQGDWVAFE